MKKRGESNLQPWDPKREARTKVNTMCWRVPNLKKEEKIKKVFPTLRNDHGRKEGPDRDSTLLKNNVSAGNPTQIFCVTGRDTNHYTTEAK